MLLHSSTRGMTSALRKRRLDVELRWGGQRHHEEDESNGCQDELATYVCEIRFLQYVFKHFLVFISLSFYHMYSF